MSQPARNEPTTEETPASAKTSHFTYHQGSALFANISRYVADSGAQSLLDIGAGSGNLALPLARRVATYLAIESDPARAARLAGIGLNVMCARFPTPIDRTFDLVLASHSIPEHLDAYVPFLEAAWSLVAPGGLFLIVTFKGAAGTIAMLRNELLGERHTHSSEFDCMTQRLSQWGQLSIEAINSYAETADPDDIVAYFASWITGEAAARQAIAAEFRRIVEARFCVRPGLYVFPTEHLFISSTKPK